MAINILTTTDPDKKTKSPYKANQAPANTSTADKTRQLDESIQRNTALSQEFIILNQQLKEWLDSTQKIVEESGKIVKAMSDVPNESVTLVTNQLKSIYLAQKEANQIIDNAFSGYSRMLIGELKIKADEYNRNMDKAFFIDARKIIKDLNNGFSTANTDLQKIIRQNNAHFHSLFYSVIALLLALLAVLTFVIYQHRSTDDDIQQLQQDLQYVSRIQQNESKYWYDEHNQQLYIKRLEDLKNGK